MSRNCRSWVPGAGAHTISRFVDRRYHIVSADDRQLLLDSIAHAQDRWDWVWLSWAAMSSHVHYGHVAGDVDPDRFFRSAHGRFARRFHLSRGGETLGPVFAHRPTIYPVREGLLSRMVAYHHRNPREAGLVERCKDSRWTSHRIYLRLDPAPDWFDVEWALDLLGFDDTASGRRQFDEFVTEVDLEDQPFRAELGPVGTRVVRAEPVSVDWERLFRLARSVTQLPDEVPLHSRRRAAVRARLIVALIAVRDFGQSFKATAQRLGVTPGALGNLVSRGGSRRDVLHLVERLRGLLLVPA